MWSKKRLSPTESTRIRPKPSNPDAFRTTHARNPPNTAKPRRISDHQTTRPPGDWTTSSAPPPHTETSPTEQVTGTVDMTITRNTRILPSPGLSGSSVPARPQVRPNTLQPALSMTRNPRLETLVESDEGTRPVNGPEHPQAHRVLRQDLPRSAPRSAPAPDSTATSSSRKRPRKHAPLPKRNG